MSIASPTLKDVSDSLANNPTRGDLIGVIETLVSEAQRANDERERLRQENEELRGELSEARQLLDSTRREQAEIRSDVHELTQTVESPDDGEMNAVEPDSEDETAKPSDGEHHPSRGRHSLREGYTAPGRCSGVITVT